MTKQEIIDLVDKYTGICDIIFSEELADALIPRIEQEKQDTLKEFVEWQAKQYKDLYMGDEELNREPTPIEYEPLDDEPITEEELRATPMHDLRMVGEIKEKYPERWTRDIEKLSSYGFDTYKYLLETHQRLKDIEDIIYGEGENK